MEIGKLIELFTATDKTTAVRLVKSLTIDSRRFVEVLATAQVIGFQHSLKRKEFSPDYAANVPELIDQIVAGSKTDDPETKKQARKANNLIDQLFVQRKQLVFHFFIKNDNEWHLFYFSERDYLGTHFKGGTPHYHYTSHLWGHKLAEVIAQTENRSLSFSTEHVEIIPLDTN